MSASARGRAGDPRPRHTAAASWLRLLPLLGGVVVLSLWAADVLPVLPAVIALCVLALGQLAGAMARARRDMDRRVQDIVDAREAGLPAAVPSEPSAPGGQPGTSGSVDLDPAQADPSGKELQRFGE
ncbi:hypothetical protein QFZ52_000336 [Arthrobacter woluwensis]|uniref:hypothetical protein n=1 Tax=Arthrobacter woluwensis TaxID=156980 RepID=UPI0027843C58|nr:hypothetical protein [Arthrobacter woluwensis]MDQ0707684.1 hypothetical protein [Arthrobacter woluwensis]